MMPASSSRFRRIQHGVGDRPTRSASASLVMRPSFWISARMRRSTASSFRDDMGNRPGWKVKLEHDPGKWKPLSGRDHAQAGMHDPKKWLPLFGKDHAQTAMHDPKK